ncbi:hypothetical protein V6N12_005632 [Hibiscus sabdariffa]|uniref:Endonuclease/exonuclease/phosphatase domain-containing protein n=1 Tax=Hibiscus sabdariffa TaxID=183260 RepID=A0ABR2BAF5_9ROSI
MDGPTPVNTYMTLKLSSSSSVNYATPKRNGQNDIQGVGGSGFQGFGSLGSSLSCCTDPKHWASGRGHGAGSVYAYPLSAVGGIAGGLALWWTNDVNLFVLFHDKNIIDTVISINGEDEWFGTFIYAPPYEDEKQGFWERLGTLRDDVNAKWCIMGDTNIVASPNEKYGGTPFDHNNARWFHEFLERSYLMEIQSKGGTYTWSNQRCEENEICEKLDRVLSSLEWSFLFPKAIAIIEIPVASDHAPIVLLTNGIHKKARTEFKFESRWTLEKECSNIVQEEWVPTDQRNHRGTFRVKLRRTKVNLWNWNREKFGKNKTSANDIANKIQALQDGPMTRENANSKFPGRMAGR